MVLHCPSKTLVLLALELVNLNRKERNVITLVDIDGLTVEEASEELECSSRTVTNYRGSAYKKMMKAWDGQELIDKIKTF